MEDLVDILEIESLAVEKVRGKANLGRSLEYLVSRSITYLKSKGYILGDFHDRPKKFFLRDQKLFCDFWFLSSTGKFIAIEAKITRNGTNLPFGNIEEHQIENLFRLEQSPTPHRGWFIIQFMRNRRTAGIFAVSGIFMNRYMKEYSLLKDFYRFQTTKSERKSLKLKDLQMVLQPNDGVILLSYIKAESKKTLDLTPLLSAKSTSHLGVKS